MFAAPGNPGIARIAKSADIPVDDLVALRDFAKEDEIDLTVVGPESPLIRGISECFWEEGLKVFGPSRAAARIEGSKVFAKELMRQAGVPSADFEAFDREAAALAYLAHPPRLPGRREGRRGGGGQGRYHRPHPRRGGGGRAGPRSPASSGPRGRGSS